MSELENRLIKCFAATFPRLSPEEIVRADINSVASWDSMASLTLTSLVEEEFSLSIDPRDREELTSFELVLAHLRRKKSIP